ncbi:hypothetical protein Acr_00g0007280 [Actinidia rufa]|uniref:CCHC-type domain-containing protein n=1 Tax=Actinidia rufa TaxID=165716 RepID=A0A7J0D8A0_9ERIC|nr:hypothetical protein Acr_00g0007280 [Actinidia rufa]
MEPPIPWLQSLGSWELRGCSKFLPCTDEQKVVFATFMFEGAALIWWQLKKPLEPLWLWPRFLEVFNEEYFPRDGPRSEDSRVFKFKVREHDRSGVQCQVYGTITICPSHCVDKNLARREGLKLDYDRTSRIRWKYCGYLLIRRVLDRQVGIHQPSKENIVSQGSSRSNELPTCPTCQKKHWGECRMGSRACYGCGQEGHQIRDCPMKSKIQGAGTSASASIRQPPAERRNNQPRQGRAFALVPGNTPATTSVVSVSLEYELSVSLPSGDFMLCDKVYNSCEIRVNDVPMYVDLIPLEMHGFDVILGMDWLSSYRALIDCELKRVVFHSFAHSGLIFEGFPAEACETIGGETSVADVYPEVKLKPEARNNVARDD